MLIRDEADPYRYAEVRGHGSTDFTTGDEAREHIDEVAQQYPGRTTRPKRSSPSA